MIYRAAVPINVSVSDYVLTRACSAIYVGTGGTVVVDMAAPFPIVQSAEASITAINPTTGAITALALTFGGAGYGSAPTVHVNAPYGGSGANITANLTSGAVTSFTINSGGTDYNTTFGGMVYTPTISFSGGGTGTNITLSAISGGTIPISVSKVYHTSGASGIVLLYESSGSTILNF